MPHPVLAPVAYINFFKPSIHGFPDSYDSRGSHCRPSYPPTVPSQSRLRGFQRSPRVHGQVRGCRRACERTPSGAAAAAPPAGARPALSLASPPVETRVLHCWSVVSDRHAQALLPSFPPLAPTHAANLYPPVPSPPHNDP
jgi:hypothetical protein